MSGDSLKNHPKRWRWRLEWLVQTGMEKAVSLLPGPWVFRIGETLGGISWHILKSRRRVVLRNLRIAFYGQYDLPTLEKMTYEAFRRTGANLVSAAHTAHLSAEEAEKIITVENQELLEELLTDGCGAVLMPAHMGNWEILSRMSRLLPKGHTPGSFYRQLNNPLINRRIEQQRARDGVQLFPKQESFHIITKFVREGGLLSVMVDQRVGRQGQLMRFFGRLTRVSPMPSLIARRSRGKAVGMSLRTVEPGKWSVRYHVPIGPLTTENCLEALERTMKESPEDVFWFQERWRLYFGKRSTLRDWLGTESLGEGTPHRALLWLAGVRNDWEIPEEWTHPDVNYEAVLAPGQQAPPWLRATQIHTVSAELGRDQFQREIYKIDRAHPLPIDFILTVAAPKGLAKASDRESIPLVSLP